MTFVLNVDQRRFVRRVPERHTNERGRQPSAAGGPRFEPASRGGGSAGRSFYGACLLAIAILCWRCSLLLVNVLVARTAMARPGLPDRRAVAPARAGGDPARPSRFDPDRDHGRALIAFPMGVAAAVYLAEYARGRPRQPADRRPTSATWRACRRSSTASSASPCSCGSSASGPSCSRRRPDPGAGDPAGDHHRHASRR